MMSSVLLRPKKPLPRRFRRSVSPSMRTFASRRHARKKRHMMDSVRRVRRRVSQAWTLTLERGKKWLLLILLILFAFAVCLVLFTPIIQVREIRVQRTDRRVDVRKVQQALAPLFGKHLLFISEYDITNRIRDSVPDLEGTTLRKEYPSRLFVSLTLQPLVTKLLLPEPSPAASGSGSGTIQKTEPRFHYLTKGGIYVSTGTAETEKTPLPTLTIVDWAVRPVPGSLLISPDMLQKMSDAENAITQEFGHKLKSRVLFLRAQELHLVTDRYALWMDFRSPLQEQLARYRVFLRSVPKGEAKQYVDLRLAGRVVYK